MNEVYISSIIKQCKYIYIVRYIDDILYEIPYKVQSPDISSKRNLRLYNCVTSKQQTVNIDDIVSIGVHFKDDDNHITYNEKHIKRYKSKAKEDMSQFKSKGVSASLLDFYRLQDESGVLMSSDEVQLLLRFNCKSLEDILKLDEDIVRERWLELIDDHIKTAKETLLSLKAEDESALSTSTPETSAGIVEDIEEIDVILEMLSEVKGQAESDMSNLDIKSIFDYWPPILLPRPIEVSFPKA